MTRLKPITAFFAAMLCVVVFLFPMTAYAASDTTPPTITAQISGETLNVTAKDDTGVAAIFIDGHRFSTLADGSASVYLKEYAGNTAKIEVYATDTSGNRSQSVLLDNPYYQAPQTPPTPTPTAPAPTSTPSPSAQPTQTPASTPATPIQLQGPDDGGDNPDGSDNPDAATPDEDTGESAIPGTAFTPDGTGTVLDNATGEDGKEFFTITSVDGHVYYLIVDRQRETDNVYFLNAVTEEDLLGLAEKDGSNTGGESAIPTPMPDPEPAPTPDTEPTPDPAPGKEKGGNTGIVIFICLAVIAAGGAGYYLKIVKPRKQEALQDDEEYDEDDEEADLEFNFVGEDEAYHSEDTDGMGEEPFDNE